MAAAVPTSSLGFDNFFSALLTGDITASSTDILMDTIPTATEGFLVIEPDSTTAREIIYYTSKTALKVVCPDASTGRGQGGTTAGAHSTGATVICAPIAEYFEALQSGSALSIGALGGTPFATGWVTGVLPAYSSATYNGNKSYDVTFASTVASYLTPGMRVRTSRTATAPIKCTDLESGSTQYYNKTSPNKSTFTDDFACMAWIKLESYSTGGSARVIMSRYNGTSGWRFDMSDEGFVRLLGYNGGAANVCYIQSYQSIPLGKWVHVAAQLDMSGYSTVSETTSFVMIDGVAVPSVMTRGGTNPTALVQAGNLEVGSANGGTFPFDGKLAQVAFFTAKISSYNTIRTYISQGLSGAETNLGSAYSFNNAITDLNTSTPNDLTAQGAAVATNVDSPFTQDANGVPLGTYDYGVVTAVSTTVATIQVPEGSAIPTTGGVSATALSSWKAPYGMTSDRAKWRQQCLLRQQVSTTSNATYGDYNTAGDQLTVPVGAWDVGMAAGFVNATTTNVYFNLAPTTAAPTGLAAGAEDYTFTVRTISSAAASYSFFSIIKNPVTLTAQTIYRIYTLGATTSANLDSDNQLCEIFAEFNLL